MDFTPSSYQQKILDCFTNTNENILVNALAGSGKSSTICLLTEHIDKSSIYIAFNASVVDEFKKKIKNPKVKVMTMHSLAYSIMLYNIEQESKTDEKPKGFGRQRGKKEVLLDNFKPYKILDDELTKRYGRYMDFSRRAFYKDQYVSLYNLCCLTMTNMSSLTEVDKLISDHTLFESYGEEDYPKPPIKEIAETLKVLDTKSKQQFDLDGSITFTDMLYITYWKIKNKEWEVPYWAQYTGVMVDECVPGESYVFTKDGKGISIKELYKKVNKNKEDIFIKSFNTKTEQFEFKKVLNVKEKGIQKVYTVKTEGLNKITATANHPILTQRGFIELSDLKPGEDYLYLDKPEKQKTKYILNDDQLQLVLASSIGDGHFVKMSDFNTYRIKFTQEDAQYNYFTFKKQMLNCSTERKIKSGYTQKENINQAISKVFILPSDRWTLMKKADARFFSIWYQDDGSITFRDTKENGRVVSGIRISCNNLNSSETSFMQTLIKEKTGANAIAFKNRGYNELRFNMDDAILFLKKIAPYMNEDCAYKNPYFEQKNLYSWNPKFKDYGGNFVKEIIPCGEKTVYDMEVEDNHNFVVWDHSYPKGHTGVVVHNCQDLSKLQLAFLPFIKRYNGRYVFIGDHHQCQPAGTKISLIDGTTKNIEDLEYGDRVVEYAISRGSFMVSERYARGEDGLRADNSFRPILNGRVDTGEFKGVNSIGSPKVYYEVLDKQRFYVDHLISIETQDGKKSSYTSNHNCLVKFNREKTEEAVCLYLMERKDGLFRIGIVHLYSSQSTLGIKARARSEGFDRCWILNIYDTQKDAWVAEQTYSLKYQIPQIIFQMDKTSYNEEDIETIYSGAGEIRSHAIALLTEFGRDINYPLWTKDNINRHTARDHCFITQSCNIIPNYMDALVFNGKENLKCRKNQNWGHYQAIYNPIVKVEHKYGHFPVYGITTSVYHTYVADGIATHNSIYGFAGADTQSFKHISSMFAPVTSFDLPVCYRCAKSHLERVNKLFDIPIKPRPNAPEGFVKKIEKDEIKNFAQPGDLIISRKNRWLAECVLSLAKAGIPVYVEDKAMVDDIRKIITKSKCNSIRGLKTHLEKMIVSYHEKIKKLAKKKAESVEDNEKKVEEVADTSSKIDNINFLDAILKSYVASGKSLSTSTDIFTSYIVKLLNTIPSPDCVRICSVHKAKGLEAENVFVLNEGKIAYDFRQSKEQNIQEKNLSYISMTRAKNGLYLVKEPTKANSVKRGDSLNADSSKRNLEDAIVNETFRRTMYGEAKNLRKDIRL